MKRMSRLQVSAATGTLFLLVWGSGCIKTGGDLAGPDDFDTTLPVIQGFTGSSDTLRFGTVNMNIGFPVSQLIGLRMDLDSVAFPELTRLDSLFVKGRPQDRIRAMAQTAAAESLDVIALQEVMQYHRKHRSDTLSSDFFAEFLAELQLRSGKTYTTCYQRINDTTLGSAWKGDTLSIHFSEGNALFVRAGIQILDTSRTVYQNLLFIPIPGNKPTQRGYVHAVLKGPKGSLMEIYNTHLEVIENVRLNQSSELKLHILDQKLARHGQVILGDFNTSPDTNAYNVLVKDASFFDAFGDLDDALYSTCCLANDALWDTTAVFSNRRIDFVLGKAILGAFRRKVLLGPSFVNSAGQHQFATDHRLAISSMAFPVYSP